MIVVQSHHEVLAAWAEYRRTIDHAPRLLTLDHHTDTSKPFRNYIKKTYGADYAKAEDFRTTCLSRMDFNNSKSIQKAMETLGNDEHIVAAIKSNIISSALVIAHNAMDTDLATYSEHKIICRSVDRKPNSKQLEKSDYDGVLESAFLHEMVDSFNKLLIEAKESVLDKKSYILDIDLDYFNTFNSIAPKDSRYFKMLVQNAGLLTVATEPEYVRSCARDVGLNSEGLLIGLQEILRQTGS